MRLRPVQAGGAAPPEQAGQPGTARLVRFSAATRAGWATGYVLAGLLGGAAFVIVPILHLCTTWALPLLGILAGVRAWLTQVALREVEGSCPACGEAIRLTGGNGLGPHRDDCPRCRRPLEVVLDPPG